MKNNLLIYGDGETMLDLEREILDEIQDQFAESQIRQDLLIAQTLFHMDSVTQELWKTCHSTKNSGVKLGCLKQIGKCIEMEIKFRQDVGQLPYVRRERKRRR